MLPGQLCCQGETGICSHLIQMGDWCDLHHQKYEAAGARNLEKQIGNGLLIHNVSLKGESFFRTIDLERLMGDLERLMGDPIVS